MTTGSNLTSSRREQDLRPAIVVATRSNVTSESTSGSGAQSPLAQAIVELQRLHEILLAGDLEPRVLTDFRDALNRVRTAAWAAQQYVMRKETEQDSGSVLSLLAGERVRVTYQLCQAISDDLKRTQFTVNSGVQNTSATVSAKHIEKRV